MVRAYVTEEDRKTKSVQRAEALENSLIARYWQKGHHFWDLAPIEDLEVLADAWEEADFQGWAENIRSAIEERTGAKRDAGRSRHHTTVGERRLLPRSRPASKGDSRLALRPASWVRSLGGSPRYARPLVGYFVYVIELRKPFLRRSRAATRPSVYVGSSALPPEARFKHHKTGALGTSRHVRRHGMRLLPRFYERYNPLRSRQEAQDAEKAIRAQLEAKGFRVYGSCHPRRNGCIL